MINYKGFNIFESETDLKNVFIGKSVEEAVEIISHNNKGSVKEWCERNNTVKDFLINSVDIDHLVLKTDPFYDTFFFTAYFGFENKTILASIIMNRLNPSMEKDDDRFEKFILKLKNSVRNA